MGWMVMGSGEELTDEEAAGTIRCLEFSARADWMLASTELVQAAAWAWSMTVVLVTVDCGGRVWPEASTVRRTVLLTVERVGVGLMVTVTGGTAEAEVVLLLLVVEVLWLCRIPAISEAIMPAACVELPEVELEEEMLLLLLDEEVKDWLYVVVTVTVTVSFSPCCGA